MSDTGNTNTASKIDQAAERAYAEASANKPASAAVPGVASETAKVVPAVQADAPQKQAVKAKPAAKPAAKKAAAKKKTIKRAAPAKRVVKQKDTKTMATKSKTETKTETKMADMAANMQDRAKTVYSKAGDMAGEMGTFTKGNMEAVVESGKILADGMQGMARETVEDAKTVFQQTTEDLRLMAAIKSPTEFIKLQSEIARRNFDAVVKYGSKRTEANVKLANDAFAPIQNRISVAGEKLKAAA